MRTAEIHRVTKETNVRVKLNLDGSGLANIQTGVGFYDHMLHHIAHHGLFDLEIAATGDLHIDEHHTVEDVAIALGQALDRALGDRAGRALYVWPGAVPDFWRDHAPQTQRRSAGLFAAADFRSAQDHPAALAARPRRLSAFAVGRGADGARLGRVRTICARRRQGLGPSRHGGAV